MDPSAYTGRIHFRFVLTISLVSALGGLLFGYDWVVIGGAKPFYERFFQITQQPGIQGWAMSSALIGCVGGAITAGWLSESFGRRRSLTVAAFLFTASALGTGWSNTIELFFLYRIVGGFGIGIASTVSPMYIAEVTPARHRGALVSLNQLTIVTGILVAQIVNYLIAGKVPEQATDDYIRNSWNGQWGWRWMFWAETIPAALFLMASFFIPESPRWLIRSSRTARASRILQKIGGQAYSKWTLSRITRQQAEKPSLLKLERPHWHTRVWVNGTEAGSQNSLLNYMQSKHFDPEVVLEKELLTRIVQ